MPALLVHYTFASRAIPEAEKQYRSAVNLGTQGPDTFMALGTVPWRKREHKKGVQSFGHLMHRLDVTPTYLGMVEYLRGKPDEEMLFAYVDGLLMHYCVDRLMHAYIFYRSGIDEKGGLSGYWNWSHGFFEAILDKVYAKRNGTYQKLSKCLDAPKEQVASISKMWAACSPQKIADEDFYDSWVDFVTAEKMLYNPIGGKRAIFRMLGKYSTAYSQAHPRNIKQFAPLDICNDKKAEWHNPATNEAHNESVDELMAKALEDHKVVHELLLRAKKGEDVHAEFKAWTLSLDHEGAPIGKKKVHYDLCWKVLGKKKYLPE